MYPQKYYSKNWRSFIWTFLLYLIWASFLNIFSFTHQAEEVIGSEIITVRWVVLMGTIFVLAILLSMNLKYVVYSDRLEIYYLGFLKLPVVVVGGKRFSKWFAIPFGLAPGTIYFSKVRKIKNDSWGLVFPVLNIKLNYWPSFRLVFFDEFILNLGNGDYYNLFMALRENPLLTDKIS